MAQSFASLVSEGRELGLSRAEAEARARDILFGDDEGPAPRPAAAGDDAAAREHDISVSEPGSADALAGAGFASLDELWSQIQKSWESRGRGVELLTVLEEINELLDRGIISAEQFQELMLRTQRAPHESSTHGSEPSRNTSMEPAPEKTAPVKMASTRAALARAVPAATAAEDEPSSVFSSMIYLLTLWTTRPCEA